MKGKERIGSIHERREERGGEERGREERTREES